MIYKKFYINLIIRILLIVLTSIILAFIWQMKEKPYTLIVILSLIIIQTYSLIRYINKTNIELGKFFNALKDNENTLNLMQDESGSFGELTKALNETFKALKDARLEKEKQFQFLKFISDEVGLGLLVFDHDGKTVLYNNAVAEVLEISQPSSLEIIKKTIPELPPVLLTLKHGDSQVFKTTGTQKNILMVRSADFTLAGEDLRLFIFQDFRKEIEDTEIETWHKMIRILSHEILNSVTPVINLASASRSSLERIKTSEPLSSNNMEELNDIILNNEIIEERMKGLSDFVIRYKKASAIPNPERESSGLSFIISHVINLMKDDIERLEIGVSINLSSPDIEVKGDKNLIEQVLINILKNSVEALAGSDEKQIDIDCSVRDQKTVIAITDTGEGISRENMERVFLPFFTTREKGSGIGLSLSRQIIRMHGGSLDIWSEPDKGTRVEITI